jgi:hypothetical protein
MPIKAENRARYPKDWPATSKAIRERAGNRCEFCRAPNGEVILRGSGKDAGTYMLSNGATFTANAGLYLGLSRGSEYNGAAHVKIILTVAHLDHQPENCDPANLKALCQKCHNAYDRQHRVANAAVTRRSRKATGDLFAPTQTPASD